MKTLPYFAMVLGFVLAVSFTAFASTSLISDYQGYRPSDGLTFEIVEVGDQLYVENSQDNSRHLIQAIDTADGSYIAVIHK